jgi:hypothetical protein
MAAGDRTQYDHRHVSLQLVGADWTLLLDAEPQQSGEDEIAAALRLLGRVLRFYRRAFDVVVGDGLYADPRVSNYAWEHGKDVPAVLRDHHPALLEDTRSLLATVTPTHGRAGSRTCPWWDLVGFTTWPQVAAPIRIVRSEEIRSVQRRRDGQAEEQRSEWSWVTALAATRAPTAANAGQGPRRLPRPHRVGHPASGHRLTAPHDRGLPGGLAAQRGPAVTDRNRVGNRAESAPSAGVRN